MSLKSFHLVFIAATLGLMGFLGLWARQQASAGAPQRAAEVCAAVGLAAGLFYLRWFLRRYRKLP